jgi:hypothetical protein
MLIVEPVCSEPIPSMGSDLVQIEVWSYMLRRIKVPEQAVPMCVANPLSYFLQSTGVRSIENLR